MSYLAVYIIIWAIIGSVFGVATNAIVKNRGYSENWFWWGFFFGFIAMIVALSKPVNRSRYAYDDADSAASSYACSEKTGSISGGYRYGAYDRKLGPNEWRCQKCGRVNADYVGTCACGNTKSQEE